MIVHFMYYNSVNASDYSYHADGPVVGDSPYGYLTIHDIGINPSAVQRVEPCTHRGNLIKSVIYLSDNPSGIYVGEDFPRVLEKLNGK